MTSHKHPNQRKGREVRKHRSLRPIAFVAIGTVVVVAAVYLLSRENTPGPVTTRQTSVGLPSATMPDLNGWIERSVAVSRRFHTVYTPCWEGAYGAIGDAYLFSVTHDSSLYRFHLIDNDLRKMCEGTWVDDRAWVCLAEMKWWEVTGKVNTGLLLDAKRRYDEARAEGRLAHPEGFWTWYNWPPGVEGRGQVFTNSNMNQMVTVACKLYDATGENRFLKDALLAWNGDGRIPGIERTWYVGKGVWKGKEGLAAFGKELPWGGTGYCSVSSALYLATGNKHYRDVAVATAKRILDPATGWVDPVDFYQLRMDGNGAFVNYLLDAYAIAPDTLREVPDKIERMLNHVWTNAYGRATVMLHRVADHGIRNGWNPHGGEDGYGVDEVGTVHAQGEAARAFGTFTYYLAQKFKKQ